MRIDRRLNLVISVDREDHADYVHAMPISREVFEQYYLLLGKTFAQIYSGLGWVAGPRVAALVLREIAAEMDQLDRVEQGLLPEIRRLANVIVPGSKDGVLPYQQAIDQKIINGDDAAEVENALVFFTVASCMHRKKELPTILAASNSIWGAQTTLLNCTEWKPSSTTSTGAGSSGAQGTS